VTKIEINVGQQSYDAVVGADLLRRVAELLPNELREKRCAIICDENSRRFADAVAAGLTNAVIFEMPAGEGSKSLSQAGKLCDEMIAHAFDRTSFVIGVGGGVVVYVSVFVAAIFQRGIPHLQVPTTLLAMVDSAIGGKCGVNTAAGKNLLGAIHQPRLIACDLQVLDSLPPTQFRQGMAEIVKHAIIRDAEMFAQLKSFRRDNLAELIERNIRIKAAIVAADECETRGERALLNFGHTVGHAIERAGNYTGLPHGDAISLGMMAACSISQKRAGLSEDESRSVMQLLGSLGLPISLPTNIPKEAVFDAIRFDKKFQDGQVRFVVTPQIGQAYLTSDVTFADIRQAIDQL
jgi:3-dehydroquinate synthase